MGQAKKEEGNTEEGMEEMSGRGGEEAYGGGRNTPPNEGTK
jgi:hypothetical protein